MPDEIQNLQLKVQEHDLKLSSMDRMMTDSVTEQRQIVRELHALTSKFDVYIERHDQVSESNKRLWNALENHNRDIADLKDATAANQPIIDGIRNLNSKLVWLVVSAVLSPAAISAAVIFKAVP
jgi:predicted  nucleic acid-binding Zn-ribbon protein